MGNTDIIQIFPKQDTGDEWKTEKHKWCMIITKKNIADELKAYLKQFMAKRMMVIDGNNAFEKFHDKAGTIMNKINVCVLDHSPLEMNSIKYKDGFEVFFLYTGMSLDEVKKYYKEFLDGLKKLNKKFNKIKKEKK